MFPSSSRGLQKVIATSKIVLQRSFVVNPVDPTGSYWTSVNDFLDTIQKIVEDNSFSLFVEK